jgi:glutamate racemase
LGGLGLARAENPAPEHRFFVSDVPHRFREQAERFLGAPLGDVSVVVVDETTCPAE